MKTQATGRKYLQTAYLTKDLSSIYKELPKKLQLEKWAKDMKKIFHQEEYTDGK